MKHRSGGQAVVSQSWQAQLVHLRRCLAEVGISASAEQMELLGAYARLVLQWNRRLNLIARGDESVFIRRHVAESLAFLVVPPLGRGVQVLDIGSGAGLPGVPMKILRPDLRMVLLEAQRRKGLFLQEAVESLHLPETVAVCARAEALARHSDWQGRFELVVARAVAPLPKLWLWAAPLLTEQGVLLTLKGGGIDAEIAQLQSLDPAVAAQVVTPPACLVDPTAARVFITVQRGAKR